MESKTSTVSSLASVVPPVPDAVILNRRWTVKTAIVSSRCGSDGRGDADGSLIELADAERASGLRFRHGHQAEDWLISSELDPDEVQARLACSILGLHGQNLLHRRDLGLSGGIDSALN